MKNYDIFLSAKVSGVSVIINYNTSDTINLCANNIEPISMTQV